MLVGVELPSRVGPALLAQARVRLAAGAPVAVAHGALAAAVKFTARGNRFTTGRAHLFAGNALAAIDRSRAFAEMGGAKTLFTACGARRSLADAARAQRMLGGRASGWRPSGTLSQREREVAELVATAKTNQKIAAALFMSYHVFDLFDSGTRVWCISDHDVTRWFVFG